MLGDVLLINDLHKRAAKDIFKRVTDALQKKKNGNRYIVAISGESGAGKSELSHSLALLLKNEGKRIKVLHTDNYYRIAPKQRTEWRKKNGLSKVGINEYDWKLLNRNILEFREGREAMTPCIDIISEQVDKLITNFADIDILVVDGLYAIKCKSVDLKIFIDLTYHETKMEQAIRGKEVLDEFRTQVLEMEHRNLVSLKPLADLIINKSYRVMEAPK